jgi:hypothetical protein
VTTVTNQNSVDLRRNSEQSVWAMLAIVQFSSLLLSETSRLKYTKLHACETFDFHGGEDSGRGLLDYDTV